jgi:hypothetical protein
MLLNGVDMDEMESIIGDLPRKRSWIRKRLKNLFRLQFFSRRNFRKEKENSNKNYFSGILWLFLIPFVGLIFLLATGSFRSGGKNISNVDTTWSETAIEPVKETAIEPVAETAAEPVLKNPQEYIETTVATIPPSTDVNNEKYYLIGGSFQRRANAVSYCDQLKKWGYKPVFIERINGLHTVAIGVFLSQAEAENKLSEYRQIETDTDAWILEGNYLINPSDE